jgi:hypothetical protein
LSVQLRREFLRHNFRAAAARGEPVNFLNSRANLGEFGLRSAGDALKVSP